MTRPIYLDYNATTPMDPRVLAAMQPFFTQQFGNASSRQHALGREAARAVERAREQVAEVLHADPREIIWTSGATESNNLAIRGVTASPIHTAKGHHIVTVSTEHHAVLDPCRYLQTHGFEVTYLSVDHEGRLDLDQLANAITDRTVLVSVMHANNEIGILHPIREIGRLCREKGVLFHTDATQSFGKEPLDVEQDGLALVSLSAHKMYGPKGVGALYVRRRKPRVRCEALFHGGGHERGVRSGTLNVPGIVGLGEAATLCRKEASQERSRVGRLRDYLQAELLARISDVRVNGSTRERLANTLNVSFEGVDGELLMQQMPGVCISSSAACTTALQQPSHVLGALGADEARIRGSIRFSLGRFTTQTEIDHVLDRFVEEIARHRTRAAAGGIDHPPTCGF